MPVNIASPRPGTKPILQRQARVASEVLFEEIDAPAVKRHGRCVGQFETLFIQL